MKFLNSAFFLGLIIPSSFTFAKDCEYPNYSAPQGFSCDARGFPVRDLIKSDLSGQITHRWQCDASQDLTISLFDSNWVQAGRGEQGVGLVRISQAGVPDLEFPAVAYRGANDFNETYFVSANHRFALSPSTYGSGPGAALGTLYSSGQNIPEIIRETSFTCVKLIAD